MKFHHSFKYDDFCSSKEEENTLEVQESQGNVPIAKDKNAILRKLISNSMLDTFEQNISSSNIVARKVQSTQDLLSVVNEVRQIKNRDIIDTVRYDVIQYFHAFWAHYTYLDLYHSGIYNHLISLMY